MATWTVLIYMSANNDLVDQAAHGLRRLLRAIADPAGLLIAEGAITPATALRTRAIAPNDHGGYDLTALGRSRYRTGDPAAADINVVVVFDGGRGNPLNGLHILRNGRAEFGRFNWDGADAQTFTDVLTTSVELFPADRFALLMSGHGTGVSGIEGVPQRLCYRGNGEGGLLTADLVNSIAAMQAAMGRPLSVLALDACLMQMVEIPSVLRGSVQYFLGSQQTVRGAGAFDLARLYFSLTVEPAMSAPQLATTLFENFCARPSNDGRTYSVINLASLNVALLAINRFAVAARAERTSQQLQAARGLAASYAEQGQTSNRRDLIDFITRSGVASPQEYIGPIRAAIVHASPGPGSGLSIYLGTPTAEYRALNNAALRDWIRLLEHIHLPALGRSRSLPDLRAARTT